MKIIVKVKTNAKQNEIFILTNPDTKKFGLKVFLKSQAKENKANIDLIELLAKYYEVSKNQVKIISGLKNKIKIIEIL